MNTYRLNLGLPREVLDAYDTDNDPILTAILAWWLKLRLTDDEAIAMIRAGRGLVSDPVQLLKKWRQTLAQRIVDGPRVADREYLRV